MSVRVPPYYFSIKGMRANEGRPRTTPGGRWKPPKSLGSNVPSQTELWYQYDERYPAISSGQRVPTTRLSNHDEIFRPSRPQQPLPALYKTVSIYHNAGVFWLVEYDATREHVNDGLDAPDPRGRHGRHGSFSQDDEKPDWDPVEFREHHNRVSYACRRGTHHNLIVRRPDQAWPEKILTDVHRAPQTTEDRRSGGLIGELPLLIGLVYLALPEANAALTMPTVLKSQWQTVERMGRGHGWRDKGGVVVSVYTNPSGSTFEHLRAYENGRYGKIFD